MQNILVYGATGAQGRPVVTQSIAAGYRVRALVRDVSSAGDLAALGAELAQGDMADAESLRAASVGQDGVYLLVPFFDPKLDYAVNAIEAAKQAGVRRIVWNATGAIPPAATGNSGVDVRRDILAALDASAVPYTALQPTVYMENLLGPWTAPEVAAGNRVAYPIPETVRLQWISHRDAAAFAVAAFARPTGEAMAIAISGPETLTGPDIARSFTRALRRSIAFRPMPPREFGAIVDRVVGGGGDAVAAFYEAVFDDPDLMSSTVDHDEALSLLPIVPTSMEAFVRDNEALFRLTSEEPS